MAGSGPDGYAQSFDGLAALAQTSLTQDPFSGHVFVFRGRRGDIIKLLWWDGQGLCLFAKRLEKGRFVWPQADSGAVSLTPAQLSMLLEGIDWQNADLTIYRKHLPEGWRSCRWPWHGGHSN